MSGSQVSKKKALALGAGALFLLLAAAGGGIFLTRTISRGEADSGGAGNSSPESGSSFSPEKRRNMLALAEDYLEKGEHQRALDLLDQLLLEDVNDQDARTLQDRVIAAKKEAEQAESRTRQAELEALKAQQEQLASLGQSIQEQTSRMESPEERRAKEERARQVNQLLGEAEQALRSEDFPLTLRKINEALNLDPSSQRAYDLKDQLRQKEREAEERRLAAESEAQRKAREALEKQVADLVKQGTAALEGGNYTEARQKADEVLALKNTSGEAWNLQGKGWYLADPDSSVNQGKAQEAFTKALENNPDLWEPYFYLGQISAKSGDQNQAVRNLTEASRQNPNQASIYYELGLSQYKAKMYREALSSFMMVEQLEPEYHGNYFVLGLSYNKVDKPQEALKAFENSCRVRPDHDASFYEAAKLYRQLGRNAEAVQALRSALALDPQARYYRSLGATYFIMEAYSEAEKAFAQALAKEASADTYHNLALSQIRQEKYNEALANATAAVRAEGNNARYLYTLGTVAENLKMIDNALTMYAKAAQLDTTYVAPRINMGILYDDQEEYDKALEVLRFAYRIEPGSLEVNNNLGNVYLHRGDYQESIQYFQKALEMSPDAPLIRFNLALALIETKQNRAAEEELKQVLSLDSRFWDAYYRLGLLLYSQNRVDEAKGVFRDLLKKNPDYARKEEIAGYL